MRPMSFPITLNLSGGPKTSALFSKVNIFSIHIKELKNFASPFNLKLLAWRSKKIQESSSSPVLVEAQQMYGMRSKTFLKKKKIDSLSPLVARRCYFLET